MRTVLIFCAFVLLVGSIWAVMRYLDNRTRDYEARLLTTMQFVETAIEETRDLRADFYGPKIEALGGSGQWLLSGIIVTQDTSGGSNRLPFSANLEQTCRADIDPKCWRLNELTIGGEVVDVSVPTALDGDASEAAETVATAGSEAEELAILSPIEPAGEDNGTSVVTDEGESSDEGDAPALAPLEVVATAPSEAAATPAEEAAPTEAAETAATEPIGSAAPAAGEVGTESPTPEMSESVAVEGSDPDDAGTEEMLVKFLQEALKDLGYDPGPIDGKMGLRTASAIKSYQRDKGLPLDGRATPELLQRLKEDARNRGQQDG